MKFRELSVGMAVMVLTAAFSVSAFATKVGDTGIFYLDRTVAGGSGVGVSVGAGNLYYGTGGEFTAFGVTGLDLSGYVDGGGLGKSVDVTAHQTQEFETFCLETAESAIMYPGVNHYVVSRSALNGGMGTGGGGDRISAGTAWLYTQFATGALQGYYWGPGSNGGGVFGSRAAAADALQKAIWRLEDSGAAEHDSNWTMATPAEAYYWNLVVSHFGTEDNAKLDDIVGEVFALNDYSDANHTVFGQDMLYYNPGGTPEQQIFPTPDGGSTVMLLGLSLGGVFLLVDPNFLAVPKALPPSV